MSDLNLFGELTYLVTGDYREDNRFEDLEYGSGLFGLSGLSKRFLKIAIKALIRARLTGRVDGEFYPTARKAILLKADVYYYYVNHYKTIQYYILLSKLIRYYSTGVI